MRAAWCLLSRFVRGFSRTARNAGLVGLLWGSAALGQDVSVNVAPAIPLTGTPGNLPTFGAGGTLGDSGNIVPNPTTFQSPDCTTPIMSWSGAAQTFGDITCNGTTGTLIFENSHPSFNVLSIRSNDAAGVSAIAAMGVDPFYPNPHFTGSISGNVLTVSAFASGPAIAVGQYIYGTNIASGTRITALGTGSGGTGTYTVAAPYVPTQTVASEALIAAQSFEHMATGWDNFAGNADFIEASTFDGAQNPLIPPSTLLIQQTGGVDTTGGLAATCSIIAGSATITCATAMGTNGNLIGPVGDGILPDNFGIPAATTLISGGGTTSGVMNQSATLTLTNQATSFTNPVYAQRSVMVFQRKGYVEIFNWDLTSNTTFDRVNHRTGIGTFFPLYQLDVTGDVRATGNVRVGTHNVQMCVGFNQPTTGQTYTPGANECGTEFNPAAAIAALTVKTPPSPVPGQIYWFSTTAAIASLTVSANTGAVIIGGTTPTSLPAGGGFSMIYNVNTVWFPKTNSLPTLAATTGSIGGGALLAGACTSGTVAVANSTTAMAVTASPVTYPGDGFDWAAYVSVAGTVTVKVCGFIAGTPGATPYNVRVIQ
jgi:hypothetical protein